MHCQAVFSLPIGLSIPFITCNALFEVFRSISQGAALSSKWAQKVDNLHRRAEFLQHARSFFRDKGICEVDCPLLSTCASIDEHIDLIPALFAGTTRCFLHSSPEYGMKRLLCEGMGDIYQISHVFRDGEVGTRHNPEFTLAEWYRLGADFRSFMAEAVEFVQAITGPVPVDFTTYRELFKRHCQLDPLLASEEEIFTVIESFALKPYSGLRSDGRDAALSFLMGEIIEPELPDHRLTVVYHYPPGQAALAQLAQEGGTEVAQRFEIYLGGLELANGYGELSDAEEQRSRLELANERRILAGKPVLPIDERFLEALKWGLPPCCGVAVGFDRLCMIACKATHIEEILPFPWKQA